MELTGKVDTVLSRGAVLIRDGAFHGQPGHGKFLARGLSQYLN
jgi:dihydropyrimidinase